jgi:phosphomannomutase
MYKIQFGTDGWRAIIAKDFTVDNVKRVTEAVCKWLLQKNSQPSIIIGHDCRFAGKLFLEEASKVFIANGIQVYYGEVFVSTPMVSLGTLRQKADLGIVITASHNPPEYSGYKLKGSFGGPLLPEDIADVEKLIEDQVPDTNHISLEKNPEFTRVDLRKMYIDHVKSSFDLEAVLNSDFRWGYDAMFGAGMAVMNELFPEIELLHCEPNPGFNGTAPEPILRNLEEFAQFIQVSESIDCGLATDGDADRIGLFDAKGNFIDSHHIILLLIHYLVKYKNQTGKVVTAFSTTEKISKLCKHYGLEQTTTQIGFKHITGYILNEDVLLGGEESGGIAIKGHIPERDGIWMGLIIWEFMAKTGKTLEQLIEEVYEIVGPFKYDRNDLHITEELKQRVLARCKEGITSFGDYTVLRTEDLDGFKYHFENDQWLLIRASGTEPVLRIYAESKDSQAVARLLQSATETVLTF